MNITPGTANFFTWLLRASWQAGVLALIVLALQWALQKKLSAAWRHALWLLVVARLLLPVSPRSALSVFNYAELDKPASHSISELSPAPAPPVEPSAPAFAETQTSEYPPGDIIPIRELPAAKVAVTPHPVPAAKSAPWFTWKHLAQFAAIIWLIGVVALTVRIVVQNILFARRLRDSRSIEEPEVVALFERCKQTFGIRFPIRLLATRAVASPALYGWWRPSLLLPPEMLPRFSRDELRYVFLHELAHVKRRDMAVHWLATALNVLHWFNPVLWIAFRRMASDRELACDELALGRAGESQRRPYGETILKLLESCARPAALPGLMGLLEDKAQMTRRIKMIAGFRAHPRWSIFAVALTFALAFATLTDARQDTRPAQTASAPVASDAADTNAVNLPRPDLTGQIKTKSGDALPKATIFIATAGPKVGSSTYCPSCYADCRKSAKSDGQGAFKIESLDPQLIFRILVAAPGCKPKFVAKVDPAKGPVNVTLEPMNSSEATPDRSVHGQVVDPNGKPIYGAVVEANGIRKKNDAGTMWGTIPGLDPLAVTDEKGEFVLTGKDPFVALDLRVEARAFAKRNFIKVNSGDEVHKLTMTEGATVTGRVIHNGKPLPGVSVGVVSTDRGMENFTGDFEIGTDADGRFSFVNLPPNTGYTIYGMMDSIKAYGVVPAKSIHAGGDGETTEVGDLAVVPAQRLAGQVVLADGKPVPANTRLLVDREGAWDSMQIILDKDGRFSTTGIPKETMSLSVNVPGYRVSARNQSLDTWNPYQLAGRVEGDVTNLVFLLEKGKELRTPLDANLPEATLPRNRPLRGAEGGADHSDQWLLSGRVLDRDTQEPIETFQVTPGNERSVFQEVSWDGRGVATGTNGIFTIYLNRKFTQPVLKVEAEGHLPAKFTVLPQAATNLEFALSKGSGPTGTVLLPNGQPAQGVMVGLLCGGQQDVHLGSDGRLTSYRNKDHTQLTDPDGNFSFTPQLDMKWIVVAGKDGFKRIAAENLAANPRITLEPWGVIKGVLNRGSNKATNEILDLTFQDDSNYFLQQRTDTDADGRFEFDHVPPGKLRIQGRIPLERNNNAWSSENLQDVTLNPGATLDVTIKAPVRLEARQRVVSSPKSEKPAIKPGPPITGVVSLPSGKPAADTDVALIIPNQYVAIGRGTIIDYQGRQDGFVVATDGNGQFSLPNVETAVGLVVANSEGYARVSLDAFKKNPHIDLQKWGRIEGVLHVGKNPGTNELVCLDRPSYRQGEMIYDATAFQARTDAQGRFIITFVPPGESRIAHMVAEGNGSWTHSMGTLIEVKPGEVKNVSVGGNGRTVLGHAKVLDATAEINWKHANAALHTPLPKSFPTNSTNWEAWGTTPEGISFAKTSRNYPVRLDGEGGFHIYDVPPGKYELTILFLAAESSPGEMPKFGGQIHKEIVVPDFKDKDDTSDVNLGTLEAKLEPTAILNDAPVKSRPAPLDAPVAR